MGTDNLEQVIFICDLPKLSHNVFAFWFRGKGVPTQHILSFLFHCFFHLFAIFSLV